MASNTEFENKLPTRSEIDKVAKDIRQGEFLRLIILSDLVGRYVQIKLKDDVNWLQTIVLIYITSRGGVAVPSHLARLTLRSNYSMTRLIDEMVKTGLVVRTRGEKDRRTMLVKVTKEGLAMITKTIGYVMLAQDSVLSCFTDANLEVFINLIRILIPTLIIKSGKRPDDWGLYYRGLAYLYFERKEEAINEFETCLKVSKDKSLIRLAKEEIKKTLSKTNPVKDF